MEPRNLKALTIEAGKTERQYYADLWRFRDLFYFLAWRDILVRYKQTVIGVAWSVLRPLLTMAIFAFVFGRIAKLPSDGVPYPLFVFAALLPWQFFSHAVTESSNSLIANANMVSKVYFPRLIIPTSSVITSFIDLLISMVLFFILMAFYGNTISPNILLLPVLFFHILAVSLGIGFWLAALNVKYRDFRYIVPFIVQIGLYITPVGFSSQLVPEKWRLLFYLNPMVSVVDEFRFSLLGTGSIYLPGLGLSLFTSLLLLLSGFRYFRKTERTFADII